MKKISLLIVLIVGLLFVAGCGNGKEEYNGKVCSVIGTDNTVTEFENTYSN